MPVPLFLGSCLHSDALLIGFAYLFTALCLRYHFRPLECPLTAKEFLLITFVGANLATSKMAYLPLLLLFLLVPPRALTLGRSTWNARWLFYLITGSVFLGWLAVSLKFHTHFDSQVNPVKQLQFILRYPLKFVGILFSTLNHQQINFLFTMVGAMGYLEVLIPNLHLISYLWVLLFAALVEGDWAFRMSGKCRGLLILTFTLFFFLLPILIYLNSIPVGHAAIYHLGGRFFVPLLPVALLVLYNHNFPPRNRYWLERFYCAYAFLSLLIVWVVIYRRYYGES